MGTGLQGAEIKILVSSGAVAPGTAPYMTRASLRSQPQPTQHIYVRCPTNCWTPSIFVVTP